MSAATRSSTAVPTHSFGVPTYSFIIPVHNEESMLVELSDRLQQVMARLDGESEVILIDDGSKDRTWWMIEGLHGRDPRFKGIRLSRNFGKEVAMTAGMDLASGAAVIVMDADLQDPPEVVLEMAARWREGYEIVYGVRGDRSSDSFFKRTSASLYYRLLRRVTEVEMPHNVGDFRLIDRRAVEAFRAMREGNRYVRGMYAWVGFRQTGVTFRRDPRHSGATKFSLKTLLHLAFDGLFSFSRVPLRAAMKLGATVATLSILAGVVAVAFKLFGIYSVPGYTSILLVVCLLGSIQLVVLGVIGQYVGRIYEEALHRPLYVASELHGVKAPLQPIPRAVIAEPPTVAAILGEPLRGPETDLRLVADANGAGSV
jgi:dolichol-phosphate mannosyltransferase